MGSSVGRPWAKPLAASGQPHGRHWAGSHGRRHPSSESRKPPRLLHYQTGSNVTSALYVRPGHTIARVCTLAGGQLAETREALPPPRTEAESVIAMWVSHSVGDAQPHPHRRHCPLFATRPSDFADRPPRSRNSPPRARHNRRTALNGNPGRPAHRGTHRQPEQEAMEGLRA